MTKSVTAIAWATGSVDRPDEPPKVANPVVQARTARLELCHGSGETQVEPEALIHRAVAHRLADTAQIKQVL